jgi:transposase
VARNRIGITTSSGLPAVAHHRDEEESMFVIGIDPHRGSHAAAVLDGDERVLAELRLTADHQQRQRLLDWAGVFTPRLWAVEGATGTGALLAQQLVTAGEPVVDVPPKLAARVRLLDNNHSDKTDSHDARSAAIVALRNHRLQRVSLEDHVAVLRLLAKRHHDLIAARTREICRLHTTVTFLVEGHLPRRLRADRAARILAGIHPTTAISVERKALARDLLAEVRRLDRELAAHCKRISDAVAAADTTLTQLHGVGPIVAAYVIGYSGGIIRFPSAGHYARYNATAPIEASSGPVVRHRLNPRGNRQLNHAIHMIAVTQVRHDTPGRAYYLRKQAEGHSRKEAMRALKRRISDAVYRQLVIDNCR